MNRTWNSESKRYTERMYRKYEMSLEEAFDKQAFEADPVGYFKSIDYKITGLDWIPAMWNLIKMAWSDYTPSKYESMGPKFGPKGQKAIAIMKQVINNNPKLKSRVERLQARAPKNGKQVDAEISELMGELKESNHSSCNRLEEGLGGKAKLGIIISLLALLTMSTVGAKSSYSKNEDWISNNINHINKNSYSSYVQEDSNITGVRTIANLALESISKTGTSENKFIYFLQDSGLIGKMDISKNDIGSRKDYEDTRDALAEDILNNIYANYKGDVNSTVSRVQKVANKYFGSVKDTIKEPTIEDVKNLIAEAINVYEGNTSSSMSKAEMEEIQQIMKGFGSHIKYAAYGSEKNAAEKAVGVACENASEAEVIEALKPYLS